MKHLILFLIFMLGVQLKAQNLNNNTFRGAINNDDVPVNESAIRIQVSSADVAVTVADYNTIENYQWGIHLIDAYGSYGSKIRNNTITYTFDKDHIGTADYYGIITQGVNHVDIFDNTIEWVNGPSDPSTYEALMQGIRSESSTTLAIHHNKLNRMGTAIYMNSVANDNYMTCNKMVKCYPGVYLDNVSNLPDQGDASTTNGNYWEGSLYDGVTYFKVNGINTSQVYWYYESTANSEFSPIPSDPFVNAIPIAGGINNCPNPLFMRTLSSENILNKIVQDSVDYPYSIAPDEVRYYNRETAFKSMKSNDSIIRNVAREQFMDATENENIGLLTAVTDSIASGDLVTAEIINDAVTDTNVIEYNKRTVNDIIIQRSINGVLLLTAIDTAVLLNIAVQDGMHGGEAVYRARAILRLRIADNYSGYQASHKIKSQTLVLNNPLIQIYPIPTDGVIYVKAINTEIRLVEVFDITGRLLYKCKLKSAASNAKIDLDFLTAGCYTIKTTDSADLKYSNKIILNK